MHLVPQCQTFWVFFHIFTVILADVLMINCLSQSISNGNKVLDMCTKNWNLALNQQGYILNSSNTHNYCCLPSNPPRGNDEGGCSGKVGGHKTNLEADQLKLLCLALSGSDGQVRAAWAGPGRVHPKKKNEGSLTLFECRSPWSGLKHCRLDLGHLGMTRKVPPKKKKRTP